MPTYKIKDPSTGLVITVRGDKPPTESDLSDIFAKVSQQASMQQREQGEQLTLLQQLESLDQPKALDPMGGMTPESTARATRTANNNPNIKDLPELGKGGLLGGEEDSTKIAAVAAAALTTPDDQELANIITSMFPHIQQSKAGPDGPITLVNHNNNAVVVVNKEGLSRQDVMQTLGLMSAFTPAAGAVGVGTNLVTKAVIAAGSSALTQTGIEIGQESLGGNFDESDVALAGAFGAGGELVAPVIAPLLKKAGKPVVDRLRGAGQQVIDKFKRIYESPNLTDEGQEVVAKAIMRSSPAEAAKLADADPAYFRHLDILGIDSEPLTSFYSRNPAFRGMAGKVEALDDTLGAKKAKFISELSTKADEIIDNFGGSTDRSQISDAFKNDTLQAISDLKKSSEDMYNAFFEMVPKSTEGSATETLSLIDNLAIELGGKKNLPPAVSRLANSLKNPTYGMVDLRRREAFHNAGMLDKIDPSLSKRLYGALSKDSELIAEQAAGEAGENAVELIKSAKSTFAKSKVMEDNLAALLKKDLSGDIVKKVGGDIKSLEIGRLKKTLDLIPKGKKQEVIVSSINEVMRGTGLGQQALNANQFVKWYENLKRNKTVKKMIFDNIPEQAQTALNSLYKVSIGVARANQHVVRTGAAKDALDSQRTLLQKMLPAIKGKLSPATKFIPIDSVDAFMSQSDDSAKAAADLMGSPEFLKVINLAARGVQQKPKEILKAESKLMKSKKYERWIDSLTKDGRGTIGGSFVNYITQDITESNEGDQ